MSKASCRDKRDYFSQSDTFLDGIRSVISVLRPRFAGWTEIPTNPKLFLLGGVARTYIHEERSISVISAVEVADDGKIDKGPEYHLLVARQTPMGPRRCTSDAARWVQRQFGLDGAEEDNHVPNGVVPKLLAASCGSACRTGMRVQGRRTSDRRG